MASKGGDIAFSSGAYTKVALHAAKHYASPVLGYLIGSANKVVDTLPICHSAPAGSILETCGEVAEKLCVGTSNKVLGLYYATELPAASRPIFIDRIVSNLQTILGGCIVVEVNQSLLADNSKVFLQAGTASCTVDGGVAAANNSVNEALRSNKVQLFADFEDHMNSAGSADFTNRQLGL